MARRARTTAFASIGANVRAFRRASGLTQEQLAEAVGLVPRYIAQIEHGQVNLTVGVLVDIAECLGAEPRMLLQPAKPEPRKPGRPPKVKPPTKKSTAKKS